MFGDQIQHFRNLPVKPQHRKLTDNFCTIIGALYALTLFVLACIFFSKDNYLKSNFPTDSDSVPCSQGLNSQYHLVYFTNINDISSRVCVSHCPSSSDIQLSCRPNSKIKNCAIPTIYDSSVGFERLGGFCVPNDSAGQKLLLKNANLQNKWVFLDILDTVLLSMLIAFGIGFLFLLLVQLIPRGMAAIRMYLAIIVLIALGVLLILDQKIQLSKVIKIIISSILFILAGLFIFYAICYRKSYKLISIFLDWSTRCLSQRLVYFFYIIFFIIASFGLVCLCVFQHVAFISKNDPLPQEGDIFLKLTTNIPLFILNIIQFIWGIQFLKDSFNFVISGLATQWYLQTDSSWCITFPRIIKNHFGSIVGGAFLNGFFNIINFIIQAFKCHADGVCPLMADCCNCRRNFFELIRTDVYAYINLTGITYCNAARNCEHLIQKNQIFSGNQSLMYNYRICCYIFTIGITIIIAYFIQIQKLNFINVPSLAGVFVFSYCVLIYFVDLHANLAEGLQIAYLIQLNLNNGGTAAGLGSYMSNFKDQIVSINKNYEDAACF